jgi:uncharacterized protein YndB with AHSA1/START domain
MIDATKGFTLVRTVAATPEQIWKAWTDEDSAAEWWHPRDMKTPRDSVKIDAREAGHYTYTMVFPNTGEAFVTGGVYLEVVPFERLVFTWGAPDVDPKDAPVVTVTLEPVGGATGEGVEGTVDAVTGGTTQMTFDLRGVDAEESDANYYEGWQQALDQLEEYLAAGDEFYEVRATRDFSVPASEVYAAWTESEAVKQWWGPTGFTCPIAELDVRVGGVSLVAMRAPAEYGGADYYNTWTYTRVDPPSRLEYDMGFATSNGSPADSQESGAPAGVPSAVPHVVTFESTGGGSRVTVVESGYTDPKARDLSKAGMEQCLDKLENLLSMSSAR